MNSAIVVPWLYQREIDTFLQKWNICDVPDWLILQQDINREGCGETKNRGIIKAMEWGVDMVVILDGDCYPSQGVTSLLDLMEKHREALRPQNVALFEAVTDPPSRGTPYKNYTITLPVAASMGFWLGIGDYCAVRQLAFGGDEMRFRRDPIFARYFPLCGMNIAFNPGEWWPWCQFIDVPRFDDIWMGWLWQREAYRRGYCFNLGGPLVHHSRQSNVWNNLRDEAVYLEKNETLWKDIALAQPGDYESLRGLLPV